MKTFILLILSFIVFSCSDDTTSITPKNYEPLPYPYQSIHFTFYYTPLDTLNIKIIADSLETNYSRITSDLNSDSLPMVNVHFYADHDSLAAAVSHVVPNLPSWASGLAISQSEIHIMSPNHPSYDFDNMVSNTIHEFAHCVSYHIRPNIANNPRWLWESVAIYESRQFVDPHDISYLVSHNPPTLSQLNSFDNTMIYQVGYLLAEFIILNWSRTHFINLILTNGNLQQVLGMNAAQFEAGWFAFVRARYGI
ncbi:MAG: hypothetical protein ABI840_05725 [bacterium]